MATLSKQFLTVSEYARLKEVTAQRVRQLPAEGRIAGERIGGRWLILRKEEKPPFAHTSVLWMLLIENAALVRR